MKVGELIGYLRRTFQLDAEVMIGFEDGFVGLQEGAIRIPRKDEMDEIKDYSEKVVIIDTHRD